MRKTVTYQVIPCRGRCGEAESGCWSSFSESELDELAPLEPFDTHVMGQDCSPGLDTLSRFAKRIEAARRLKYGG